MGHHLCPKCVAKRLNQDEEGMRTAIERLVKASTLAYHPNLGCAECRASPVVVPY
jgi:hypothetical protein